MSDSTHLAPDLKTRPYWWDAAPPVEAPSGDAPTAVDVAIVGGGWGGTVDAVGNILAVKQQPQPEGIQP